MYTTLIQRAALFAAAIITFGCTSSAFAQTAVSSQSTITGTVVPSRCTTPVESIAPGLARGASGRAVTALQERLSALGYFNVTATGYFGPITYGAVVAFQRANGLPQTGYFGPLTHAMIHKLCSPAPQESIINVHSIQPRSGGAGTQVTITGNNFTSENTVHFGNGVVVHVPVTSTTDIQCITTPCYPIQTISFTVPESLDPACRFIEPFCGMPSQQTMPGSYTVYVENTNGRSNSVTFTVTGETSSGAPKIASVSPQKADQDDIVSLRGSGFSDEAVLHFYQNGEPYGSLFGLDVDSASRITFEVPEWIGAYCHVDSACIAIAKSLPSGTYMISIETRKGTSNQVTFIKP